MTAWSRLPWLDAARGLAVVAMVAYHFVWDLGNFDYIDRHFPYTLGFKSVGHGIALSFLFIAGVSLVLAHERDASFRPFWRRLARIVAAALLVTLGTYLVFPEAFVFFGILHCIAAASLLAVPFLFLPWPAALLAAAAAFLAPHFLTSPFFDAPWLSWLGLSTIEPTTNDYQPLLPWSGGVLAGVAFAKFPGAIRAPVLAAGRQSARAAERVHLARPPQSRDLSAASARALRRFSRAGAIVGCQERISSQKTSPPLARCAARRMAERSNSASRPVSASKGARERASCRAIPSSALRASRPSRKPVSSRKRERRLRAEASPWIGAGRELSKARDAFCIGRLKRGIK